MVDASVILENIEELSPRQFIRIDGPRWFEFQTHNIVFSVSNLFSWS